jgi:hypothetical protein
MQVRRDGDVSTNIRLTCQSLSIRDDCCNVTPIAKQPALSVSHADHLTVYSHRQTASSVSLSCDHLTVYSHCPVWTTRCFFQFDPRILCICTIELGSTENRSRAITGHFFGLSSGRHMYWQAFIPLHVGCLSVEFHSLQMKPIVHILLDFKDLWSPSLENMTSERTPRLRSWCSFYTFYVHLQGMFNRKSSDGKYQRCSWCSHTKPL